MDWEKRRLLETLRAVQLLRVPRQMYLAEAHVRPAPLAQPQERRSVRERPLLSLLVVALLMRVSYPLTHRLPSEPPRRSAPSATTIPSSAAVSWPLVRRLVQPALQVAKRTLALVIPHLPFVLVARLLVAPDERVQRLLTTRAAVRLPHLLLAVRLPNVLRLGKRVAPQFPRLTVRMLITWTTRLELARLTLARLVPRVAILVFFAIITPNAVLKLVREIRYCERSFYERAPEADHESVVS